MAESQELAVAMFAPHVGDKFQLEHESSSGSLLELVAAEGRETHESQPRAGFSLVFHDPAASANSFLPQAIYQLKHEKLGTLEIFIVPIGPPADGQGVCYEAVFA